MGLDNCTSFGPSITDLRVKESGCYNIESKVSYTLDCPFQKFQISQFFPQGITIIYNDLNLSNITGTITFNNNLYSITSGIIALVVIGNYNFGVFNLKATTKDVIKGTITNTILPANYLISNNPITINGGLINGFVVSDSTSQMIISSGTLNSLSFVSDAVIINPSLNITLSYNGQVILPYQPEVGLFVNNFLLFKTILPSLKINNVQLLFMILSQLGIMAGTSEINVSTTSSTSVYLPIFGIPFASLFPLILDFPPQFLPQLPDFFVILDNAEVSLSAEAKLHCSDILYVRLLNVNNLFNLNLICRGSNIILNL